MSAKPKKKGKVTPALAKHLCHAADISRAKISNDSSNVLDKHSMTRSTMRCLASDNGHDAVTLR